MKIAIEVFQRGELSNTEQVTAAYVVEALPSIYSRSDGITGVLWWKYKFRLHTLSLQVTS